jgi:hypothetical protein
LGFKEAAQKGSKALPDWYYGFLAVVSGMQIVIAFALPLLCNKPYSEFLLPVIGLASFGLLGIGLSVFMYQLKSSAPSSGKFREANTVTKQPSLKIESRKPQTKQLAVLLILLVAIAAYFQLRDPVRKYSSKNYWQTATLSDVADIPEEALAVGNKNGSVLMFAAMSTSDPAIIEALVKRGADIHEADTEFGGGVPITGAAISNSNPAVIDKLIELGADVNVTVSYDKTPLILAAELNRNGAIIERLIFHGADVTHTDTKGRTALDRAKTFFNTEAIAVLEQYDD